MYIKSKETKVENEHYFHSKEWLLRQLKDKPIIWSAFIMFDILLVMICFYNISKLLRSLSTSKQNAYRNLVRSGFFKRWLIRDLYGLTYNPTGIDNQIFEDT